jgi:hypothetical protein
VKIQTVIQTSNPNYPYDETQAAAQVLAALGGNPADDVSEASITKQTTHIVTNVELDATDSMAYTPAGAAAQVLAALAGNATVDYCIVTISWIGGSGEAGVPPGSLRHPGDEAGVEVTSGPVIGVPPA